MKGNEVTMFDTMVMQVRAARGLILLGAGAVMGLGGCVQVTAPDKPIEIALSINIRQVVVYQLDSDAKALIEQNTEIF
jgi:YnbE-like lipoprotein